MEHTIKSETSLLTHRRAKFERPVQLAAAAGVSLQTVLNLEAGKNQPNLRTARLIAAALDTPIDVLFPPVPERKAA